MALDSTDGCPTCRTFLACALLALHLASVDQLGNLTIAHRLSKSLKTKHASCVSTALSDIIHMRALSRIPVLLSAVSVAMVRNYDARSLSQSTGGVVRFTIDGSHLDARVWHRKQTLASLRQPSTEQETQQGRCHDGDKQRIPRSAGLKPLRPSSSGK